MEFGCVSAEGAQSDNVACGSHRFGRRHHFARDVLFNGHGDVVVFQAWLRHRSSLSLDLILQLGHHCRRPHSGGGVRHLNYTCFDRLVS